MNAPDRRNSLSLISGNSTLFPHDFPNKATLVALTKMPSISRFFGIVVFMYWQDHLPPHFHAEYGDFEAQVDIETLEVLHGKLPRRAKALVLEWAAEHRDELRKNWQKCREMEPLSPIDPLE